MRKNPCKRECWGCGNVEEPLSLREAIELLTNHSCSTHRLVDFQREIRVVLAAARAFSCEQCGGTGIVRVADTEVSCRNCSMSRVIASEGCR